MLVITGGSRHLSPHLNYSYKLWSEQKTVTNGMLESRDSFCTKDASSIIQDSEQSIYKVSLFLRVLFLTELSRVRLFYNRFGYTWFVVIKGKHEQIVTVSLASASHHLPLMTPNLLSTPEFPSACLASLPKPSAGNVYNICVHTTIQSTFSCKPAFALSNLLQHSTF